MKDLCVKLILFSVLFFNLKNFPVFSQSLPVGFSAGEYDNMPAYLDSREGLGITTPPLMPVRTMAEWEEIQALVVTWTDYTSVLREVVKQAKQECPVYIICSDSNSVKNYLTSGSVTLTNLHYIIAPFNTIWMRDYGANTVYTNNVDSLILVDWIYNRPRPDDDVIPSVIASEMNIPIYETTTSPYKLIHTGGNFMSDGFGTAFSSKLVLSENPSLTEAEVDSIMKSFMGITRYIKMNVLPYDGIHHIDMHMKLLDEETLLVGEYPSGVADGPQIEANLQYVLSNFNSVFGTPYKVIRIPMPPDIYNHYPDNFGYYTTFTNSVFVNKTILMPLYYQKYDTTALRIMKQSLPGYHVVGINCNSIIPASGAIHCITHSIGVADPLLISHQSHANTADTVNPYKIEARIQHRSGIQSTMIYFRTDTTQPYQSISMLLTDTVLNLWTGYISSKPMGTSIYYYIQAQSNSGKQQARPIVAPSGSWRFNIEESLGIANLYATHGVNVNPVYPNPSKGITCIPVSSTFKRKAKIMLVDMIGREVAVVFEGYLNVGEKNYFINTTDINAGSYLIVLKTEDGIRTQKLMVR